MPRSQASISRSQRALASSSIRRRAGSASNQAMVLRMPWVNGTVAQYSGTKRLILELSKTTLTALSPIRLPRKSGMQAARKSLGIWTSLRLGAGGFGRDAIPLVPGHHFVAGDVKCMADGLFAAEESHQSLGEVGVVGDDPEGRSVARNDDLPAAAHAVDDRVRTGPAVDGERDLRVAVGEGRTDDGDREAFLAVGAHQPVFAGDFLLGIGPEGIREGRRFGDEVVPDGLLVGAGRTDEDELPGAAAKEFEVAFDV